jgi:hypothetical protein
VRDRHVAEREPQHDESEHRGELRPLGYGAEHEAAGDRGERRLERDVHELVERRVLAERRGHRELAFRRIERALEEEAIEPAEIGVALGEREAVAVDAPQHRHHGEHDEHLHQHRQRVLRAHHAAVEKRERRHAHHQHQRGRGQHPRDVALVRHRRGLGLGFGLFLLRLILLWLFLLCVRGRRRSGGLVSRRSRGLVLRERRSAERESDQRQYSQEFLHGVPLLERSRIGLAGADADHFF